MSPDDVIDRLDLAQQRIRPVAFAVAVLKRFGEDRGSQSAALISYYGFLSLFPLLLALTTIAGIALEGNTTLQQQVLDSVANRIPVVGTQIEQNVQEVRGNGLVLAVGLVIAIVSGLGVVQAAQDALNVIWDVPRFHWPDLLHRYLRNIMVLGLLGLAVIAATGLAVAASVVDLPTIAQALLALGTVVVNTAVILLAFKVLIRERLAYRDLMIGAVVGGVALFVLQLVGGFYIDRVVTRATDLYGVFAVVIGLVVWLNLNARVLLLSAEIDVVRSRRLWPRSLSPRQLTDADRAALVAVAAREAMMDGQTISVAFEEAPLQAEEQPEEQGVPRHAGHTAPEPEERQ